MIAPEKIIFICIFVFFMAFSYIRWKRNAARYTHAVKHYNKKEYKEAVVYFEKLLKNKPLNANLLRCAIYACFRAKEYEKGVMFHKRLESTYKLISSDYINLGMILSKLGQPAESLAAYEKSLALDPENKLVLNNIGYTLLKLQRYADAFPYLDKLIGLDPNNAFGHNNRGHARMKLGDAEGALADICLSQQLDPANSYTYLNLGIYNMDQKEYAAALRLFLKAKEMDADTDGVSALIAEAERHVF